MKLYELTLILSRGNLKEAIQASATNALHLSRHTWMKSKWIHIDHVSSQASLQGWHSKVRASSLYISLHCIARASQFQNGLQKQILQLEHKSTLATAYSKPKHIPVIKACVWYHHHLHGHMSVRQASCSWAPWKRTKTRSVGSLSSL